jgi:hypothetical protein
MAEAWHIARSSRTCAHTGQAIEPGQPFYSALLEKDDTFERRDFSFAAWPEVDKEPFFSYWKNKGRAESPDKAPPVDYDRLLGFFDSLEGAEEPGKRLFRYVLALILVRRRRLRLDDMSRVPEGDRLLVYDRRANRAVEIVAPDAGREELEKTQEKLNQLFDCDFNDGEG